MKGMSCERALNFDQWKTFSENYEPMRVWLWFVYKLLRIIVARHFSPQKEVSYLTWQNTYPTLKTTCQIKLKCLWTKLLENVLLAKYLISVAGPLIFKKLCKHRLSRQPILTSKTYNHTVGYNHTSADGNLGLLANTKNKPDKYYLPAAFTLFTHFDNYWRDTELTSRSSNSEVFLGKGILKICSKFTGEHSCWATLLKSHFGMGVLQ